jgi:hypothetical protein
MVRFGWCMRKRLWKRWTAWLGLGLFSWCAIFVGPILFFRNSDAEVRCALWEAIESNRASYSPELFDAPVEGSVMFIFTVPSDSSQAYFGEFDSQVVQAVNKVPGSIFVNRGERSDVGLVRSPMTQRTVCNLAEHVTTSLRLREGELYPMHPA